MITMASLELAWIKAFISCPKSVPLTLSSQTSLVVKSTLPLQLSQLAMSTAWAPTLMVN